MALDYGQTIGYRPPRFLSTPVRSISSRVEPVSSEFVPIQIPEDEKINVPGFDPRRCLRTGWAFCKQHAGIVIYLYVNA